AAANSLGSYTTPADGGFSTTAPIEGFLYVRPNTASRYQAITRALTASRSVTLVLPEMGGITTPFPDRPQLGLIHGDPLDTSRINLVFVGDGYTDTEEPFTDQNGNGLWDGDTYLDENRNGRYDSGEQYYERNGIAGYQEPEPFQDLNGDLYRNSGEQGLLDRNALDYARVLLGTPPWPDMSERINMWRVRTISNQTAGSFPEFNIVRDTALRTSYGNKATGFIISVSNSAATQLVQTLLPEYDHIITISNSPVGVGRANANYGGNIRLRGGDFDNLSTVATHELGHAVGLLSDEYTDSTVIDSRYIYKGLEPGGPNTTANPNPGYTKWAAELDGTLPYPTPPDLAGTGIFEGAGTYFRGRYRPEYNCMMRLNTPRFCVICDREIRAQIIDRSSTGTGAFPLLVCRLDAAGSDRLTTAFSVLNPDGARKLPMALAATGGSGQLVIGRGVINPRDMSLLPRHQDASFEREHFGPLTPQESWVRVSSNGAYKGFYLISDPEFDVKMDGAVADPEASVDLAVPYVALDHSVRFRLSVVNPSTRSARAAVTYYDAQGTALQEEERSLPSRGQALFSPPAGQRGWIRVRSVASPPVMLQAAAYSYDSRRLAVQSGAALDVPTSLLTLPHYAIGAGYETRLVLVSAGSVSLEITARRVDGSLAALPVTRTLGPMQQLDQSVRDLFGIDPGAGVAVGYITVAEASLRPEVLRGVTGLTYFTFRDNSAAVSPAERTAREVLTFSHVANEIPAGIATAFMTGLTLVNPSDRDARLKVTVHDARGAVLRERDLVLPAKNKISRLLTGDPASSSFFPPGLAASSGYIIVTSDVPLFGFELFFTGDLTAMVSVPAQ
ncbi:MAG: M64 family metallopeptidase, partial [Acidobacteriota bacterium]